MLEAMIRAHTAQYLGPSIDVGPAMMAKMLKGNGQIMHRMTYQALTDHAQNDLSSTNGP